jgi:hypothetical protein
MCRFPYGIVRLGLTVVPKFIFLREIDQRQVTPLDCFGHLAHLSDLISQDTQDIWITGKYNNWVDA